MSFQSSLLLKPVKGKSVVINTLTCCSLASTSIVHMWTQWVPQAPEISLPANIHYQHLAKVPETMDVFKRKKTAEAFRRGRAERRLMTKIH